jgi:hypothetical protein
MRYHFDKPDLYTSQYGEVWVGDHPVYHRGTLYKIKNRGLVVIQQRHDPELKTTWWDVVDEWLTDAIYLHPGFWQFFNKRSGDPDENGLYPTVTVRQILWALKMKPLKKERWETVFDRKDI